VKRTLHTAKYIELVEHLAAEMGHAHGWQRRAAERLGISTPHLTRILNGEREVGRMLAERAVERLGLNPAYFSASTKNRSFLHGSVHDVRAAELERLLSRFDAGVATVDDVFELARAVAEAPAVREARAILRTKKPRTEREIGALFMAASRLVAAVPRAKKKRKSA
jgi:transcriptional regulator with XRE-family HTH domain